MPLVITANDRIWLGPGDSLTAGFASVFLPYGFMSRIRAAYGAITVPPLSAPFTPTPKRQWPQWLVPNAVAGRATELADVGGSMATIIASQPFTPTVAIVQLGINDAANIAASLWTLGQCHTKTLQILNALTASPWNILPGKILWIGPWQHGFVGDIDTQRNQVRDQIRVDCTAFGANFCDLSGVPNTGGNANADGTHPTAQGVYGPLADAIMGCIALQ